MRPIIKSPFNIPSISQELLEEENRIRQEHPELSSEEVYHMALESICE